MKHHQLTLPGRTAREMRDRGASLVEYALLLALIAVTCLGAVTLFGSATNDSITQSHNSIIAN